MKENVFKDFTWEKDGNGEYIVTYLKNGKTLIAVPRLGKKNMFCIRESQETEQNVYGQEIPKRYNKFEVMEYLKNMR